MRLGQGDRIGILDNRAAAYCRLGNLESGLGDGRQMIKSDKKDARVSFAGRGEVTWQLLWLALTLKQGYLRTAKVLQLMKKMDEALRVYDHALKTLDSGNEYIQVQPYFQCPISVTNPSNSYLKKQIRTLRAKLDKVVNGERLIDPFTKLPAELISEILDYLDLRTLLFVSISDPAYLRSKWL